MPSTPMISVSAPDAGSFTKETLIKGRPARIECVRIADQTYSISKGPLVIARLEDEWFEDVDDPAAVIEFLSGNQEVRPDIFTFWQRPPHLSPKYPFHVEFDDIAVLPTHSYDDWFNRRIKSRVRTSIRKAEKDGLIVKETVFDDAFVRGMTAVFNEAPTRQGARFWHYGKDFETVKQQFSRFVHREHMIGAYFQGEMIGFVMLGNAGRFGVTGQILSSIKHRDKATNAALIAKAVEVCEQRRLAHLVYLYWTEGSLTEFKRRVGFEKTPAPRYFVPLTLKGRLAISAGLHRGWRTLLPRPMKDSLKRLRSAWYARQE